ncbi:hypothetical protein AAVH_01013 [Aphelenchoides avenae]|nr:hypothetical protein AAVH_01013 [Aphelenchus avenae]
MTKRRRSNQDLPNKDDDSIKDLIQEFRDRLHAPSKYVTGSRPSTTHDDVHGHYAPVEEENALLRRLLAKAIPILESHSNAKKAHLRLIPDVLVDVLSCCDGLTQVHVQLSGPYLRNFLAKRIPKARVRIDSAGIGVRYKHSDDEDWLDYPLDYDWEFVARARLAGCSVPFIFTSSSFSEVAAQLAARIQSAYIKSFTASEECLAWNEANLPDFLAKTDTASDIVVEKLQVLSMHDGDDYVDDLNHEIYLGRYAQLVLATFEEIREVTIGEWVAVNHLFEQENTEFSASFLARCLGHGIADVNILKLGVPMDTLQLVHFCLADNVKLGTKQRKLVVGNVIDTHDSFRSIVEPVCKEVATGRVKHGFVLSFEGFLDPTSVMEEATLTWMEDQQEFAKVFDDESTLRVKCGNGHGWHEVTVTFHPK